MTKEDLKALNEIEEINQETYCNKHSEWVLGWHKHADHEDNNEIENLRAKTHYWITVVKCCSKGIIMETRNQNEII